MPYAPACERGRGVHRFLPLLLVFAAAACGGDGASPETPTNTVPPATNTSTQQVAGDRTATPASPTATVSADGTYTIVAGDTLSEIAQRFGTTVEALVSLNGLSDADERLAGSAVGAGPGDEGWSGAETPLLARSVAFEVKGGRSARRLMEI